MVKGNGQKTDSTMAKEKLTNGRQYHGQRETDKIQTISLPNKGNNKITELRTI
jgi:hypothetical protein